MNLAKMPIKDLGENIENKDLLALLIHGYPKIQKLASPGYKNPYGDFKIYDASTIEDMSGVTKEDWVNFLQKLNEDRLRSTRVYDSESPGGLIGNEKPQVKNESQVQPYKAYAPRSLSLTCSLPNIKLDIPKAEKQNGDFKFFAKGMEENFKTETSKISENLQLLRKKARMKELKMRKEKRSTITTFKFDELLANQDELNETKDTENSRVESKFVLKPLEYSEKLMENFGQKPWLPELKNLPHNAKHPKPSPKKMGLKPGFNLIYFDPALDMKVLTSVSKDVPCPVREKSPTKSSRSSNPRGKRFSGRSEDTTGYSSNFTNLPESVKVESPIKTTRSVEKRAIQREAGIQTHREETKQDPVEVKLTSEQSSYSEIVNRWFELTDSARDPLQSTPNEKGFRIKQGLSSAETIVVNQEYSNVSEIFLGKENVKSEPKIFDQRNYKKEASNLTEFEETARSDQITTKRSTKSFQPSNFPVKEIKEPERDSVSIQKKNEEETGGHVVEEKEHLQQQQQQKPQQQLETKTDERISKKKPLAKPARENRDAVSDSKGKVRSQKLKLSNGRTIIQTNRTRSQATQEAIKKKERESKELKRINNKTFSKPPKEVLPLKEEVIEYFAEETQVPNTPNPPNPASASLEAEKDLYGNYITEDLPSAQVSSDESDTEENPGQPEGQVESEVNSATGYELNGRDTSSESSYRYKEGSLPNKPWNFAIAETRSRTQSRLFETPPETLTSTSGGNLSNHSRNYRPGKKETPLVHTRKNESVVMKTPAVSLVKPQSSFNRYKKEKEKKSQNKQLKEESKKKSANQRQNDKQNVSTPEIGKSNFMELQEQQPQMDDDSLKSVNEKTPTTTETFAQGLTAGDFEEAQCTKEETSSISSPEEHDQAPETIEQNLAEDGDSRGPSPSLGENVDVEKSGKTSDLNAQTVENLKEKPKAETEDTFGNELVSFREETQDVEKEAKMEKYDNFENIEENFAENPTPNEDEDSQVVANEEDSHPYAVEKGQNLAKEEILSSVPLTVSALEENVNNQTKCKPELELKHPELHTEIKQSQQADKKPGTNFGTIDKDPETHTPTVKTAVNQRSKQRPLKDASDQEIPTVQKSVNFVAPLKKEPVFKQPQTLKRKHERTTLTSENEVQEDTSKSKSKKETRRLVLTNDSARKNLETADLSKPRPKSAKVELEQLINLDEGNSFSDQRETTKKERLKDSYWSAIRDFLFGKTSDPPKGDEKNDHSNEVESKTESNQIETKAESSHTDTKTGSKLRRELVAREKISAKPILSTKGAPLWAPSSKRAKESLPQKEFSRKEAVQSSNTAAKNSSHHTSAKTRDLDRLPRLPDIRNTNSEPKCEDESAVPHPNLMKIVAENSQKSLWEKIKSTFLGNELENDSDDEPDYVMSEPKNAPKTKVKINIIQAICPENVAEEKEKFFDSKFSYDPHFKYSHPCPPEDLMKYSGASEKYLKLAEKILQNMMNKFGSFENYEQMSLGSTMSRYEILQYVESYCEREGISRKDIMINISKDLLSTASMGKAHGFSVLSLKLGDIYTGTIEGVLRHELGTHYVRRYNNNLQPWSSDEDRKKFKLLPVNPTEEGFASIHSVINRPQPLMVKNAILYYTVAMASKMSFQALFHALGKYVNSPDRRWELCMRAKRGQIDTSQPGCFAKDQVYLTGSLNLLKSRKKIDFKALMQLGKVAFEDVPRLLKHANKDAMTIVPSFLHDRKTYLFKLDQILMANGLKDSDFSSTQSSAGREDDCRFDI